MKVFEIKKVCGMTSGCKECIMKLVKTVKFDRPRFNSMSPENR